MTSDTTSPASHGWLSSTLYRVSHFGRGRPKRAVPAREAPAIAVDRTAGAEVDGPAEPAAAATIGSTGAVSESAGAAGAVDPPAEARTPELLDPLQRARAVLADARRQMPGMLGDPSDDEPERTETLPAAPAPGEQTPAEWRGALAQLRAEQERFLEELAQDRERLLTDLNDERELLLGAVAAEREQLIAAFSEEHRRLLDDMADAQQELLARFEAERAGLASEILDLRGLLSELQGEIVRLTDAAPAAVSDLTPAPTALQPEAADHVSRAESAQPAEPAGPDEAREPAPVTSAEVAEALPAAADSGAAAQAAPLDEQHADVVALEPSVETATPEVAVADDSVAEETAPTAVETVAEPEAAAGQSEAFDRLMASLEHRIRAALARPLPFPVATDDEAAGPLFVEPPEDRDTDMPDVGAAFGEPLPGPNAPGLSVPEAAGVADEQPDGGAREAEGEDVIPFGHAGPAFPSGEPTATPDESIAAVGQTEPVVPSRVDEGRAGAADHTAPAEPDVPFGERGNHAERVAQVRFLAPGEPVSLVIGPLAGLRRLSALEQQLAAGLGAERVELHMFRDGEASFRLRLARVVPVVEVLEMVDRAGGNIVGYEVDDAGRGLRVHLPPVPARDSATA